MSQSPENVLSAATLEHVKQQAAIWKQEAKTNQAIVKAVAEVLGMNTWDDLAGAVRTIKTAGSHVDVIEAWKAIDDLAIDHRLMDMSLADAIRAAVKQTEQQCAAPATVGVPNGWKLVPVEATKEMLAAHSSRLGAKDGWSAMLAASPTPPAGEGQEPVAWAVERWNDEVANRPMVNVHRRTLDDTWRQVIRQFGGDDRQLIGLTHDELLAEHAFEGQGRADAPDALKAFEGKAAEWSAPQAAQGEPVRFAYRILKTEDDLDEAIARLSALMDKEPPVGSDDDDELQLLALLIECHEKMRLAQRDALAKRLIGEVIEADDLASSVCQSVAELPDRNSPEGWPEAMIVTQDELHLIVREAVIDAQASAQDASKPAQGELSTAEIELDAAGAAFEDSKYYFKGESPAARIANWRVWVTAWKVRAALSTPPTDPVVEISIQNGMCIQVASLPAAKKLLDGSHRLYTATPPMEGDAMRQRIGEAITEHMAGEVQDGVFAIDPFDSRNIDPIVDAAIAAMGKGGEQS